MTLRHNFPNLRIPIYRGAFVRAWQMALLRFSEETGRSEFEVLPASETMTLVISPVIQDHRLGSGKRTCHSSRARSTRLSESLGSPAFMAAGHPANLICRCRVSRRWLQLQIISAVNAWIIYVSVRNCICLSGYVHTFNCGSTKHSYFGLEKPLDWKTNIYFYALLDINCFANLNWTTIKLFSHFNEQMTSEF